MGILGEIIGLFILLFLLGTLFRFLPVVAALPLLILEKFKKLGMPNWLFWVLASVVVWGGVTGCLFIIAYVAGFFGW